MRKRVGTFLALFLVIAPCGFSYQKNKPKTAGTSKPALTDEEKEILKNRELLENLELLRNFEKIQYLDFFADRKAAKVKEKPAAKPAAKEDARKASSK
jgi:hypothetical protein